MKRLICIFMSIVIVLGVSSCSKSNISKSYSEKSKVQFIEFIDYITYELKDLDDSAISDVLNEYYALNDNIKMKRLNAILNAINYPDNIFNININVASYINITNNFYRYRNFNIYIFLQKIINSLFFKASVKQFSII